MGLYMEYEDGVFVPSVNCDCCGERIECADEGNYEWKVAAEGEPEDPRIYFSHKGNCSDGLRAASPGFWCWSPLEVLPLFLGNSLYMDWKRARETARMFAG